MALQGFQNREAAPTDARQVRSRKALNAALLALLEEKPFDQITIRDISARSGTGYATFFRHYPSKEALLGDVASEEIAGLLALATPILATADSYESTLALCTHVASYRKLWTALLTGGASAIVRAEFIRQARELGAGMQQPRQEWLPMDLGIVYGTGGTFDLLAWWLSQDEDYTPEQIATMLDRLIIAPLVGGNLQQGGDNA
ncbi:MAG: helix-turn-helix domain-containing protein [Novosphingobium sp.]